MAVINGTSVGGMTLQADYTVTTNTAANTSTVAVTLKLVNHYALYASALAGSYISVGGSKSDYSKTISYGGSSTTTTTLATKTVTVNHNSDGSGTCNIAGTFVMNGTYRGTYIGTMSVNQTITLTKIARASGLTVSSSVNTGSALSGTITPSSTAFNHKVLLKIGSTTKHTISVAAGTTSWSYTIPHSWLPNTTSQVIDVVLETYNGSTFVANTTKSTTASVPSSIVPTVSAFTAAIAANGKDGLYVQGKTTAKLTATATAGSGATITSYTYSGANVSTAATTAANITTSAIQLSGNTTYRVTVQDSRGRTASKEVTIYIYPYNTPSIGSVSVQRCLADGTISDSGTYARYTINTGYSPVNGKNTRTVTAAYSSNNGSSYSAETTLQATTDTSGSKTGTYGGGAFVVSSAYLIRFTIKDSYNATSISTVQLQTAVRPININKSGKGVAIGGMSTKNEFECSMPADFNSTVNIDGKLTLTGGLSAPLSIINGGTGATTADGIAMSHNHLYVSNAGYGGEAAGYSKIATIKINGAYVNQGIELSFIRRQDQYQTKLFILFQNANSTDPNLAYFNSCGPTVAWIYKTSSGTWDIYAQRTGWDNISIMDIKNGYNNNLTITPTDVHAASLPSGVIQSAALDYIVAQGTSNSWVYRRWQSGASECWRKITGTVATYTTWNNMYGYQGSAAFPPGLFIETPIVEYQVTIGTGFSIPARGAISDKDTFKWVALGSANSSSIDYRVDAYAVGKWK